MPKDTEQTTLNSQSKVDKEPTSEKTKKKSKDKDKEKEETKKESKTTSSEQKVEPKASAQQDQPAKLNYCQFHKDQPITKFCITYEEPVCDLCVLYGPHNSNIHEIESIATCKQDRKEYLDKMFKEDLPPQMQNMSQALQKFQDNLNQLTITKQQIWQEINQEYQAICSRLDSFHQVKTLPLEKQIHGLYRDMNRVKDIKEEYDKLISKNRDIEFLIKSGSYYRELTDIIQKPLNLNLQITTDDYPRELEERQARDKRAERVEEFLLLKDEIIKKLILQSKTDVETAKSEMEQSTKKEMVEWEQLTDKFAQQLQRYQMVCAFCLTPLDEHSVNGECKANVNITELPHRFTHDIPPKEYIGTGRHFFSKPIRELFQGDYKKPARQPVKKSPTQLFFESQSQKIRQACMENKVDLMELMKQHDRASQGKLNYIQFSYLMNEFCKINQEDVATMINYLDPSGTKTINYNEFCGAIYDPDYFTYHQDNFGAS